MKKKIIAAFLTTAMTIGSLSGVTVFAADAGTDEKVEMADASDVDGTTITFWHSMGGVNGEAIDTLVKKFNDENEYGITVDAQYQGEYDDSLNKLKSAQIGNMGADLVQVYEIGTRFMIDSGWIVPMQQMIDADSYDVSEIEPNLAAYYTIDNELYSMPFNSSTPIMYYNKDMFDKAGITEIPDSLEGIGEIGQDLLDKGGAGEVMSLGIYGWFFEQFIGKQGLEYANNGNGRKEAATAVAFDENSAAKNILTAWKDLNDKGFAPVVGKGGAIFSAIRTMLNSLDFDVSMIDDVYVAGGIGSGINMANAVHIGMFPDIPLEKFHYIGNSSLTGAYLMLHSTSAEKKTYELASNMTYLELSTVPTYMDEFVGACFIPHTDTNLFPSVMEEQQKR